MTLRAIPTDGVSVKPPENENEGAGIFQGKKLSGEKRPQNHLRVVDFN